MTRDGILVARHERQLQASTNVAELPEFAARRATQTILGEPVTDWFVEDFTLAELQRLRARETRPELRPANAAFNDRFAVPALAEVIRVLREEGSRSGRVVGLYPELKDPEVFRARGHDPERVLLAGLSGIAVPVYIQSFDADSLRRLRPLTTLPPMPARPACSCTAGRFAGKTCTWRSHFDGAARPQPVGTSAAKLLPRWTGA
ncbi:MAG: glycerophosphodiester phosphodiesterase family protein [Gammaproteobacteria bacterium]